MASADAARLQARHGMRRTRANRRQAAARQVAAARKSARARRLEKDPEKWLLHYFPDMFPLPFSDGHREIINAIVKGDADGRNVIVAAPRGEGKSTIEILLALYLVCAELSTFPIIGCWQKRAAREAFNTWKMAVSSEKLIEDYPHLFQPFAGHPSPLQIRTDGTGADIQSDKLAIVLPGDRGALAAGSLQGDIKGFAIDTLGGKRLRPDKLLLDDPQDVDRADSQAFVQEVLHKIDSQWLCLAGPSSRISMMAAVTIYAPNDVGDSLGHRADSVFVRIARVTSWPDGFDDKKGRVRELWDTCYGLRCTVGVAESVKFYRKHRAEMTAGMSVSWKERYSRKLGDPDAFYSAMCDYYRLGHAAFYSEYQNEPVKPHQDVYRLTPSLIQSRIDPGRLAFQQPEGAAITVASADLNPTFGLTWGVYAFSADQSCKVLAYDVFKTDIPESLPRVEWNRRLFSALTALGRKIAALPCKPRMWAIDASGTAFDVALAFATNSLTLCGLPCMPMTGRAGKNWNPFAKNRIGEARNGTMMVQKQGTSSTWLAWNADVWRETMQRAWLCEAGSPGGVTLYDGANHVEFSQQLCREVLEYKVTFGERVDYKWRTLPGDHDYSDATAQAYALAGFYGMDAGAGAAVGAPAAIRRRINPAARNANVRRY